MFVAEEFRCLEVAMNRNMISRIWRKSDQGGRLWNTYRRIPAKKALVIR